MPVLTGADTLDSTGTDYGSDTLDTYLPQTYGQEPLVTFARPGGDVQFIQLVPSDQELPGWPLVTTMKVTTHKCDKCTREFCSLINYRRHIKVHRRSLNVDKESHKFRDVLAAFWDKLSPDDAREIASISDAILKETRGSVIVQALASSICKPGFWTIPHAYMLCGTLLLDVISGDSARFPISSGELLSILDDASEQTFLCAGMAETLEKYVFDAEAVKVALDSKNVTASAVFLLEQKLVKAWLAEKDAEALRCQKLLVEEEEAAQKRLTKLLEKKKQKKLRQREQKAREQSNGENLALAIDDDSLEVPFLEEASSPQPVSDAPDLSNDGSSTPDPVQFSNDEVKVVESQLDIDSDLKQRVEAEVVHPEHYQWQISKSPRVGRNSSHGNQNIQALNVEAAHKHIPAKDRVAVVSSNKVWTKKTKEENVEPSLEVEPKLEEAVEPKLEENVEPSLEVEPKLEEAVEPKLEEAVEPKLEEAVNQADGTKSELLIGSMTVLLGNSTPWNSKIGSGEQLGNSENLQHSANQVSHQLDKKISLPIQRVDPGTEDVQLEKLKDRTAPDRSTSMQSPKSDDLNDGTASDGSDCVQSSKSDYPNNQSKDSSPNEVSKLLSGLQFSTDSAKAFLSQSTRVSKSEIRSGVKPGNYDYPQHSVNQVSQKLWMPVNRQNRKISQPILRVGPAIEDVQLVKSNDQSAPDGSSCVQSSKSDDLNNQKKDCSPDEVAKLLSGLQFSTEAAEAFLSQRWNEAMSAEHMTLEAPAEAEAPAEPPAVKKSKGRNRKNQEKGVKVQYIPRQKVGA